MSNLKVWRYLSTKSKRWEKFITTREDREKYIVDKRTHVLVQKVSYAHQG